MIDYLHHITTSTGHTRRSPRSEVADDTLAIVRPILRAALRGRAAIPGVPDGYSITAASEGDSLIATVWHDHEWPPSATVGREQDHAPRIATDPYAPLVTIGVARSDADALALWAQLRTHGDVALDRPPPAAWCAAVIHQTIALYPDAAHWLGDFERCLAWAWASSAPPHPARLPARSPDRGICASAWPRSASSAPAVGASRNWMRRRR